MDKLKINYNDLNPDATLALLRSHKVAMTSNLNYPTPVPDDTALTATITLVAAKQAAFATADAAWETAHTELLDAVDAGHSMLGQRATNCNSVTPGDKAKLTTSGLPLISTSHTPTGATPRVENLKLTGGDIVGTVDGSWNSLLNRASSYQVQSALNVGNDPNTATWVNQDPVTKSSTTIGPFTSGTRIWVRVRAVGTNGTGDWSDPATIIVP